MSEELRSRELFKSYSRSLDAPGVYNGKKYDKTLPEKCWFDEFLLANPTFVGKREITSPHGFKCTITYGKNFVEYPYGVQQYNGEITVDRLIITRDDAILFNLHRGDEGTADTGSSVDVYFDFPWDRPLAGSEVIKRRTPFEGYRVFTEAELVTPEEQEAAQLTRIEEKLDQIIALLD